MNHASQAPAAPDPAVLARLSGLVDRPEAKAAALIDFAGIEHGRDVRFFHSLDHYLESWLGDREVFRLPGPRLLILVPDATASTLDRGTQTLARVLRKHGFGTLHCRRYDLKTETRALIADLLPARSTPRATLPPTTPEPVSDAALGQLLEAERALHGADLESLLRERPVWRLAPPDAHPSDGTGTPEAPHPEFTELAVALDELGMRLGFSLRRNRWLEHEVAALLDRSLLRHVARDRLGDARPLSFDLHMATVLERGFADLVLPIPAEVRRRLTIELPAWDIGPTPDRLAAAAATLADLGFGLAIDGVAPEDLATLNLGDAEVRFVKTDCPAHADAASTALLQAGIARFGPERLVLCTGDVPDAIEAGLAAGIQLFQGRAADKAAATRILQAKPSPASAKSPNASADADGEPAADTPTLFGWLFGSRG